jgi:hypothetical protein
LRTCVFCRRQPVEAPWAPFCSERCRLQDLARWINGSYRVAGEKVGEQDTAAQDEDSTDME